MSINIKNKEAEQLLAELKTHTGKGTTDLLLDLLRQEKARLDAEVERQIEIGRQADRRLQEQWAQLPIIDPRPLDQIIEYDEDGLPV